MSSLATKSLVPILLATLVGCGIARAQGNSDSIQDQRPVSEPASTSRAAGSTAPTTQQCWKTLTESVQDAKHLETRAQALNALSSLGWSPRAVALISEAMKDSNVDIRTAAVLAAGKAKSRGLLKPVKQLLDDPEPQVVFAAAITLWQQFKDKSGEDVLAAIAAGDRKANPGLVHGVRHDISRTLHSPSALARIGIQTGAGLVLGPFGFSVAAIEYMRKNGADTARVQSIDLLAEQKTEAIHDQLRTALDDDDPGVRAAAVKALANFHRPQDSQPIKFLLDDSKLPVRLAASAAYIDCLSIHRGAKTPHA